MSRLSSSVLTLAFLAASTALAAAVPAKMNYQGRLTLPGAGPVPDSTGNTVVFRIFDAPTLGTQLWTETWNSGTSCVTTTAGLFNVELGKHTTLSTLAFDIPYYLEIQVNADPQALSPRQALATAPYAFRAGIAEAVSSSGGVPGAMVFANNTSSGSKGVQGIAKPNFNGVGVQGEGKTGVLGLNNSTNGVGVLADYAGLSGSYALKVSGPARFDMGSVTFATHVDFSGATVTGLALGVLPPLDLTLDTFVTTPLSVSNATGVAGLFNAGSFAIEAYSDSIAVRGWGRTGAGVLGVTESRDPDTAGVVGQTGPYGQRSFGVHGIGTTDNTANVGVLGMWGTSSIPAAFGGNGAGGAFIDAYPNGWGLYVEGAGTGGKGAVVLGDAVGVSATAGFTGRAFYGRISSSAATAEFINDKVGSSPLKVNNMKFPSTDTGFAGKFLGTDGAGNLTWTAAGVGAPLNLVGSLGYPGGVLTATNTGNGHAVIGTATQPGAFSGAGVPDYTSSITAGLRGFSNATSSAGVAGYSEITTTTGLGVMGVGMIGVGGFARSDISGARGANFVADGAQGVAVDVSAALGTGASIRGFGTGASVTAQSGTGTGIYAKGLLALDAEGALAARAVLSPGSATANTGRIYFDSTTNRFMVSENGSAYQFLVTPGVVAPLSLTSPSSASTISAFNNSGGNALFGMANLTGGAGVYGVGQVAGTVGVYGASKVAGGIPVIAEGMDIGLSVTASSGGATGIVVSTNTTAYGIDALNTGSGPAVMGRNQSAGGTGVYGQQSWPSNTGAAVYGANFGGANTGKGVFGTNNSAGGVGVYGQNLNGKAMVAEGGSFGVSATASNGWGGSFDGVSGVVISGESLALSVTTRTDTQAAVIRGNTGFGLVAVTNDGLGTGMAVTSQGMGINVSSLNAVGVRAVTNGTTASGVWATAGTAGSVGVKADNSVGRALVASGGFLGVSATASTASGQAIYGRVSSTSAAAEFINDNGYPLKVNALNLTGSAGTAGQVLTTNGSNLMSWANAPAPTAPLSLTNSVSAATTLFAANTFSNGVGVYGNAPSSGGIGVIGHGEMFGVSATVTNGNAVFARSNHATMSTMNSVNAGAGPGLYTQGGTGIEAQGGIGGDFSGNTGVSARTGHVGGVAVLADDITGGSALALKVSGSAKFDKGKVTMDGRPQWEFALQINKADSTGGGGIYVQSGGVTNPGYGVMASGTNGNTDSSAIYARANGAQAFGAGTGPYALLVASDMTVAAYISNTAGRGLDVKGGTYGISTTANAGSGTGLYAGGAIAVHADGPLDLRAKTGVAVAGAGTGRIYYDDASNKFKVSEDGSAYTDLLSPGVVAPVNLTSAASAAAALYAHNSAGGAAVVVSASAGGGGALVVRNPGAVANSYGLLSLANGVAAPRAGVVGSSDTIFTNPVGSVGIYGYSSAGTGVSGYVNGAANSGNAVSGENASTNNTGTGVYALNASPSGYALVAHNSTLSGFAVALSATTRSVGGTAIYGHVNSSGPAAEFINDGSFNAVLGSNNVANVAAVEGNNAQQDGIGVLGKAAFSSTGGTTPSIGVKGESNRGYGYGVYGVNIQPNGSTNYGVYGKSASANGKGVYGENYAGGFGVWGSTNGMNASGVYGDNTATANTGSGIQGYNSGTSNTGSGVLGTNFTAGGYGVIARNTGATGTTVALSATSAGSTGIAGYFQAYNAIVARGTAVGVSAVATGASGNALFGNATSTGPTLMVNNNGTGAAANFTSNSATNPGLAVINSGGTGIIAEMAVDTDQAAGVRGEDTGGGGAQVYGVLGQITNSNVTSIGVVGRVNASAIPTNQPANIGLAGLNDSISGWGLYARAGGTSGKSFVAEGAAIAISATTSGTANDAIYANLSSSASAIRGINDGTGMGVSGFGSGSGIGVKGSLIAANGGIGVQGLVNNNSSHGVYAANVGATVAGGGSALYAQGIVRFSQSSTTVATLSATVASVNGSNVRVVFGGTNTVNSVAVTNTAVTANSAVMLGFNTAGQPPAYVIRVAPNLVTINFSTGFFVNANEAVNIVTINN